MLDFSKLDELAEGLEQDKKLVGSKDFAKIVAEWGIKDSLTFKILPETHLGKLGTYFHKKLTYKIGGKYYTSKASMGDECIIAETIERYNELKSGDKDIKTMFEDWKTFSKTPQLTYLLPCVSFEMSYNKTTKEEEIKSFEAFILEVKMDTLQYIHAIISAPKQIKSCGDGSITSRTTGRLLTIKNINKKLTVQADPDFSDTSDAQFDELYENAPNVLQFLCSQMKSDEHLESVVQNYFEGIDIINDDGETKKEYFERFGLNADKEEAKEEPKKVSKLGGKKPATIGDELDDK